MNVVAGCFLRKRRYFGGCL